MQKPSIDKQNLQFVKQLGTGSYGTVHLVKKIDQQKQYALKSVKLNTMSLQDKNKSLNQVRLLASICSPYVIQYQGAFFDKNSSTLCILMEYADGGDLMSMVDNLKQTKSQQQNPIGFQQQFILEICFCILQGINTLHKNKIVHRDLKSANIFFSKGIPKIGDLNVSKAINNQLCSTQTGTPYYTCPQVWKGVSYNQKCDIWSLGVLLYEMCSLCFPFCAPQLPGLLRRIFRGQYKPISEVYSKNLANLIQLCLTLDPQSRPSAQNLLKLKLFQKFYEKHAQNLVLNKDMILIETIKMPRVLTLLEKRLKKVSQQRQNAIKKPIKFKQNKQPSLTKTNVVFRIARKGSLKKFQTQKCIDVDTSQDSNLQKSMMGQSLLLRLSNSKEQLCSKSKMPALRFKINLKEQNKQPLTLKKLNYLRVKSMKKIRTAHTQLSDSDNKQIILN